jgi:hypothetical protein
MKSWIKNFNYYLNLFFGENNVSTIFINELNKQTAIFFEKITGLNPLLNTDFFMVSMYPPELDPNQYTDLFPEQIRVNILTGMHSFNCLIKWRSKSGKIYKPTSLQIDPDDIEFWIVGLEKEKILEIWNDPAYNPKTLGFKHKKTHFNLEIEYFHYDAFYIVISLKDQEQNNLYLTEISNEISGIFENHNIKSESKSRRYGLVHDFGIEEIKNNRLVYYIDYGSANDKSLKDVIEKLNSYDKIEKVVFTGQKE